MIKYAEYILLAVIAVLALRIIKFISPEIETKEEKNKRVETEKTFSGEIINEAKKDKKPMTSRITGKEAVEYAKRIHKAIGIFTDDEAAIFAVFKKLRTKVEVTAVSIAYRELYKKDLFTVLKQNLTNKEFKELNEIISKKPLK